MLPHLKTAIPGPQSRKLIAELAQYESPAITARHLIRAREGGIDCPIVWAKTHDVFVEDVDGNRFIDLCAGFGVASVGHANPRVVKAGQAQLAQMPHAMGDVFPAYNKILLAKRLAEITPGNLKRSLFANAGCEAVEAALKTAMIKTGKPGIIAFENSYHGLSYGALAVTAYREHFRRPFLPQMNPHIYRLPFPRESIADLLEKTIQEAEKTAAPIGALIIEPILGRGGMLAASLSALQEIREICTRHQIVMIADEIFTGFGRSGAWFAIEAAKVVPDLLCIGKGMNGGFPISAVIGSDEVMSGWADTQGEAIHTSTYLGNPVGCAMALACIEELENGLLASVNQTAAYLQSRLQALQQQFPVLTAITGRGLMLGLEFGGQDKHFVLDLTKSLLQKGLITLSCGLKGNTLGLSPPFTITSEQIDYFITGLADIL